MAGARKGTGLDTRTARLRLRPRHHPYWVNIAEGAALGYWRGRNKGTWLWRVYEGVGRYRHGTIGEADDYADANGETLLTYFQAMERARAEARNVAKLRGIGIRDNITVIDAAERYMRWFRSARKSFDTTQNVIDAHILPTFGTEKVSDLTAAKIREWHHKLAMNPARKRARLGQKAYREKPQSDDARRSRRATANRILTVLKAILNKAYEDDLVASADAWSKVRPFNHADEPITRFLTEAECVRLLNACRADLRALVRGALLTGARYGELAALPAQHVNLDTRSVFIAPSKSGRGRHVPLNSEGFAFFKGQCTGRLGDAPVFTKLNGEAWGTNHHVRPLVTACERAKIAPAITFHELRHTYASLLAQAGADLLTISKLLGHADTRVTARHYAHLCDRTLANAVNMLLPSFGMQDQSDVTQLQLAGSRIGH